MLLIYSLGASIESTAYVYQGEAPRTHLLFTVYECDNAEVSYNLWRRFATKTNLSAAATSLESRFTCMRTRQPLALRAASSPAGLKVWLHCDTMELAGELLQVREGEGGCRSL